MDLPPSCDEDFYIATVIQDIALNGISYRDERQPDAISPSKIFTRGAELVYGRSCNPIKKPDGQG
jgi:hypothetical protein